MQTTLAIIGGGFAGLTAADITERAGLDWQLFEARGRFGGRALSLSAGSGGHHYDVGPAWIWPQNRRMHALAARFGVPVHEQHAEGLLVFEDRAGQVRRDLDIAPMAGARRLGGGLSALVDAMAASLPSARLHRASTIKRIEDGDHGPLLHVSSGARIEAGTVLLALPPRIIAERIDLPAPIRAQAARVLGAVPTWMAGHAKIVAVYDRPFWREAGLSGSAISHRGPLVEMHDASPADGAAGALFGFVGVPGSMRAGQTEALKAAAIDQFARLFGDDARRPAAVLLQDWAAEGQTATPADADAPGGHPTYGPLPVQADLAGHGLWLAGSEVAPRDGGFLEGAVEAAEIAMAAVLRERGSLVTAGA